MHPHLSMHRNKCNLENTLQKLILLGVLIGLSGTFVVAQAQEQFDIGFAVSGLTAPPE